MRKAVFDISDRLISSTIAGLRWFRGLPGFVQWLLAFPIVCGVLLFAAIGNMGLALMGSAILLPSLLVGWLGGVLTLILAKAGLIIAKDRRAKN